MSRMKTSESGAIILGLLNALEQYVHPALRSKALADDIVVAREYLGSYIRKLAWIDYQNGESKAECPLGTYLIAPELNNYISLQFEDYVLAIATKGDVDTLKEQAEHDFNFREKQQKRVLK